LPSVIHENLILDHYLFCANDEEFDELKTLFLKLGCATHQHVKADDDEWEGLYIYSRSQHYLEILRHPQSRSLGICQRAAFPILQDARRICEDFPALPWKTFERSHSNNPWYAAMSCDDYTSLTTPFNTWVMHYYPRDIAKTVPLKTYEVQDIFDFELVGNPNLVEKIKLNSAWFNAKKSYTDENISFEFQTYYSDPFKLNIKLDPQIIGIQFKKIKFSFKLDISKKKLEEVPLKHFSFENHGEYFTLEKI
jgi:hypothetical protein